MKRMLATAVLLLTATVWMSGQQVLTVDNSGNVTATGAVSGNGLNSQGAAGGQVSIVAGADQLAPGSGFGLQAPGTITNAIQVVVPNASGSGLWHGVQSTLPAATAHLSGTSVGSISVNSGGAGLYMPTAPIIVLTGGGCSPPNCATASANMTGTYPFLTLNTITVNSGGSGYTSAPTVTFLGPSGSSPNMLNLLFQPISANTLIKGSSSTPLVPVSALASEVNNAFVPGENIDLQANATLIEIPNYSTAPVANELAITTPFGSGTTSSVTVATTSSTTGVVGVCVGNCSTSGSAQIAREGVVSCKFDGTATPGDFVQASTTTAGDCSDTGSTAYPSNGHQVLGRVLNGGTGAATYTMIFYPAESELVACATCVTSAASLSNNSVVLGSGGQGTQTSPNFTTSSAQLNLGQASTTTGTLGIYGSGSATAYTLSTNSAATSLATSGNLTVGPTGTQDTVTLNTAGSGGITLSPSSSSGNTITVPAVTDTMAVIGTAQTWTAAQTFNSGINASNVSFNANGSHIQTNTAGNDIAGTATIGSGTKTVTVTFTTNYSSKPVCVVTPETDGTTSFDLWYITLTASGGHYPNLVISTHANAPSGGVVFDYHCIGNPN
jgi:hypothetical protein